MTIKSFLTGLAVLLTAAVLTAQTPPRPSADGQKERAERRKPTGVREHAEEKSQGAAFSGRGRGGEKDLYEKERKKGRKKHGKRRSHQSNKPEREDDGESQSQTRPRPDDAPSPAPTPQRRAGERPTSGAEQKGAGRRQ